MIDSKIRITAIAEEAGVSPSTVSRVLNRNPAVKEDTRRRVCEAMTRLGMKLPRGIDRPTPPQASAARHNSDIILILIPNQNILFHFDITRGICDSAKAHGVHAVTYIGTPTPATLSEYISLIHTLQIQGIIAISNLESDILEQLLGMVPVIQCCEYSDENHSYVSIDDRSAARNATEYILSTGHRKIAFLNGGLWHRFARYRYEGFKEAMQNAGIEVPKNWVINLPRMEYDSACAAATQLLSGTDIPDGIFAASDTTAIAAINMARNLHIRIPEDLVVVGFDDVSIALMSNPTLTTVSVPTYQIGFTAMEVLMDKMRGGDNIDKHILFNPKLVIRASSSAVNADTLIVTRVTR